MGTQMSMPFVVLAQQRYCSTLHCCRRGRPFKCGRCVYRLFQLFRRDAVFLLLLRSACAALHDAARVDAGTFSAAVRTATVRYKAVDTVSGDAYTILLAYMLYAILLLLVHVLPFTMLLGSMLPLICSC